MRVLVLGGTRFVGRAIAAAAVDRGWQVTVFHRGVSGTPPAGARSVFGDRSTGGVAAIADQPWDVVVDTWDGSPEAVRDAADVLRDTAGRYVYVSSRSVYRQPLPGGLDEDAPLVAPGDGYGGDKLAAEHAVRDVYGMRALVARAGLVLGPHEHPTRLVWWLRRVARGGDVLAPGPPYLPLQYIDVRDLAGWLLDTARDAVSGTFNAVSRPGHTTMAELLEACREATGSAARLRWAEPETILAAGVQPWSELPIWIPDGSPVRGLHETNTDRAHAAGLRCRPVVQTVADTWAWLRSTPDVPNIGGLNPARESALLDRIASS
ncbi:NAD-dependent epimerase/dehydratase family protein [Micromonospora sp. CA-240977]|uniref:NAD-dependent epimerase/dehydratase family protein n=1 Tax=Micromonospora sp. CA-240977 TaxID=3239957 RepID=UPI003D8CCB0A